MEKLCGTISKSTERWIYEDEQEESSMYRSSIEQRGGIIDMARRYFQCKCRVSILIALSSVYIESDCVHSDGRRMVLTSSGHAFTLIEEAHVS